jgi:hypothetical protein
MEKQLNESTLHRLTAGQNGFNAQEQAAKGRLVSQVGDGGFWGPAIITIDAVIVSAGCTQVVTELLVCPEAPPALQCEICVNTAVGTWSYAELRLGYDEFW